MTIKLSDINIHKLNKYKILTFKDLPQREVREVLSKDYKHNVNSIRSLLKYLKEYRKIHSHYLHKIVNDNITLFMALSYEEYYYNQSKWDEEMGGEIIKNIILTYVYYKELERLYQTLDFKLFIQIAQSNNDIELLKELDKEIDNRASFKNNHLLKNYINNLIPKRIKAMIKRF